jgi:hypothetical protein
MIVEMWMVGLIAIMAIPILLAVFCGKGRDFDITVFILSMGLVSVYSIYIGLLPDYIIVLPIFLLVLTFYRVGGVTSE